MYGYFRPYQSSLTQGELNLFNAYYCRICYCLRLYSGQASRFFTTYDAAIYAMIINLENREPHPPVLPCQRLRTGNMKLFEHDNTGMVFARISLISFGAKVRDDLLDGNNARAKACMAIFGKAIKKAENDEPLLTRIGIEGTGEVNRLQNEGADIYSVLSAYSDMAIKSFSSVFSFNDKTAELLRAISEWIFFVDMICDYAEDYKSDAYNALKTPGLATFKQYFNAEYAAFMKIEKKITGRLVDAVMSVRDDSMLWNTLFKIILNSVNTIIPDAIEGKDIKYNYFKEVRQRYSEIKKHKATIKRLGLGKK